MALRERLPRKLRSMIVPPLRWRSGLSRTGEARAVYETDDAELVASTFAALDDCTVGGAVDERMSDAGRTLVFVYEDGSEQSVEFEGGNIVLDKTAYRLDGADELWRQLAAIKNSQ